MNTCNSMPSRDITEAMEKVDGFGERLRHQRKAKHWTQLELARRMGIAPMEVSNYERGASKPKLERAVLLAQVLDVSTAWLVFGEGEV